MSTKIDFVVVVGDDDGKGNQSKVREITHSRHVDTLLSFSMHISISPPLSVKNRTRKNNARAGSVQNYVSCALKLCIDYP